MYEYNRHGQCGSSTSDDEDVANTEKRVRDSSTGRRHSVSSNSDEEFEIIKRASWTMGRQRSLNASGDDVCLKDENTNQRRSIGDIDDIANEDTSEEIKYLIKQGILPKDFPLINTNDRCASKNDSSDLAEEINVLLTHGAITDADAEVIKRNREESIKSVKLKDSVCGKIEIPPFDNNGIPVNWTKCNKNSKSPVVIELEPREDNYALIAKEFERAGIGVRKIERLENQRHLKRFKLEMEDIQSHRDPGFNLNIHYLYHGTNVEKERICEEGLDQRLSRMGYFGKGIYFSDNPLKCVHYSEDSSGPSEAYILMCRVILGSSKEYPVGCYDTRLKREPEKENQSDGWRYYDSVVGCPKDYNEYVVYENRRAMIEYIISFTSDDQLASVIRNYSSNDEVTATVKHSYRRRLSVEDDHLQKINEVRESVRQKRMEEKGIVYLEPSLTQREHDQSMWNHLQKLHLHHDVQQPQPQSEESSATYLHREDYQENRTTQGLGDLHRAEVIDLADESEAIGSDVKEADPVDQVLSSCMAEFMAVTDCEDSSIARHYVQKALQDVNLAITLYFEDM